MEAIKFLRSRGASLNATDRDNFTPLHCAVLKGQTAASELLIDMGANYLLKDAFMRNVLHIAVQEQHSETLKMLLKKGCSNLVNQMDKDYRTPLHYAAAVGNIKVCIYLYGVTYFPLFLRTRPHVHPCTRPPMHPCTHSPVNLCTCARVHACTRPPVHPCTQAPVHPEVTCSQVRSYISITLFTMSLDIHIDFTLTISPFRLSSCC